MFVLSLFQSIIPCLSFAFMHFTFSEYWCSLFCFSGFCLAWFLVWIGCSLLQMGFSLWWLLLLSMGSRCLTSVVVVRELSCPVAWGSSRIRDWTHIPCIGRWTQPLNQQGSPDQLSLQMFLGLNLLAFLILHFARKYHKNDEVSFSMQGADDVDLSTTCEVYLTQLRWHLGFSTINLFPFSCTRETSWGRYFDTIQILISSSNFTQF